MYQSLSINQKAWEGQGILSSLLAAVSLVAKLEPRTSRHRIVFMNVWIIDYNSTLAFDFFQTFSDGKFLLSTC